MKFTVSAGELRAAVGAAGKAVAARTTKPILEGAHLDAIGDELVVSGTDLDLTVRVRVGCKIEAGGRAVVSAKRLKEVLGTVAAELVEVTADDAGVRVREVADRGAARFELPGWEPDEFPLPAGFDPALPHFAADLGAFRRALGLVRHAANRKPQEARFFTEGVRMEFAASAVKLLATDTKQLAFAECPVRGEGEPAGFAETVPLKAVAALDAFPDAGDVGVAKVGGAVVFAAGAVTVTTRLVEGRFPPYQQLVPGRAEAAHRVAADVAELARRVRQAAVTADDESNRLDIEARPGLLVLRARGAASGSSEVECGVGYEGAGFTVSLDPGFVLAYLDALKRAGRDEVVVEVGGREKPVVFRPATGGEWNLVMPMGD